MFGVKRVEHGKTNTRRERMEEMAGVEKRERDERKSGKGIAGKRKKGQERGTANKEPV